MNDPKETSDPTSKQTVKTLRRLQIALVIGHSILAALFLFILGSNPYAKYVAIFIAVLTVMELMFLQKMIKRAEE